MFTVSDLFNSFREVTVINNSELSAQNMKPENKEILLNQRLERKRTSQIFYAGFVLHFGKTPKKQKEVELKYDEGI